MRTALFALAIISVSVSARAQPAPLPDWAAQPRYGTVQLIAGFGLEPETGTDPHVVQVEAGGENRNAIEGNGCEGYISAAPLVDVLYEAGPYKLFIYAEAKNDLILLINQPDGSWICDDDAGEGDYPAIVLNAPQSGRYNVWVGTFQREPVEAKLFVTEVRPVMD